MGKILAGELRIFWRSIYMPGVFAAVLGYLNWLCYPSLERAMKAADPYQFLYHYRNMQGFTVLLFACMFFLSFELFYKVPADDVWEYAGSYGATGRIATAKLMILGVASLLLFFNSLLYTLVGYWTSECDYGDLFWQIVQAHLLNDLLPMAAAVLIGAAAGLYLTRIKGYVLICVLLFYISPLMNTLSLAVSRTGLSLGVVEKLSLIQSPNLELVPVFLVGMPVDLQRWSLIFAWCAAGGTLLAAKLLRPGWMRRVAAGGLCAVCLFTGWYGAVQDTGALWSYEGQAMYSTTMYRENIYYGSTPVLLSQPAESRVEAYDIRLSLKGQLDARVTMEMETPLEEYRFTLYHMFTVSSVTDGAGQSLPFHQVGDYLTVTAGGAPVICVTYSGVSDYFYTNNQAVFLPANFVYFPIPGFVEAEGGVVDQGIAVKDAPSFTVQVDAWCPVFSNLTRDPKTGLFTGTTNGVTFIGGLTEEWTEGGLRRIASPLILQLPVDLEKIRSEAAELASYFPGLILENPADGLQTIIAQPEVSASGALKTYKDHAITGETGATNEEIAESLVLGSLSLPEEATQMAKAYLAVMSSESARTSYLDQLSDGTIPGGTTREQYPYMMAAAYEQLGAEELRNRVMDYLADPGAVSCSQFLGEISRWDELTAQMQTQTGGNRS